MTNQLDQIRAAAEALGEAEGADILFYNGEISRASDYKFIEKLSKRKRRKNVVLVLVTPGGDADAAYRMCRALQSKYEHLTVFITGWCKSAGTLIAIGAHRLVMSDFAELGPLDVQLGKRDELFEYGSGLDIDAAMKQLEVLSFGMFEDVMMAIETASEGRITFKTASQLSYEMVTKLFGNLYAQIDPIEIGKTSRLMTIARAYGERLAGKAKNFKRDDALELLVSSYFSHSFVIDLEEASEIFRRVEKANALFERLHESMGDSVLYPVEKRPDREYVLTYLNKELPNEPSNPEETAGVAPSAADPGSGVGPAEHGPIVDQQHPGPADQPAGDHGNTP